MQSQKIHPGLCFSHAFVREWGLKLGRGDGGDYIPETTPRQTELLLCISASLSVAVSLHLTTHP